MKNKMEEYLSDLKNKQLMDKVDISDSIRTRAASRIFISQPKCFDA